MKIKSSDNPPNIPGRGSDPHWLDRKKMAKITEGLPEESHGQCSKCKTLDVDLGDGLCINCWK